jgi:hypothetical protein
MKPMAAAVAGALISGVAMYTVGARTTEVDAFTQTPGQVQLDPGIAPAATGVRYATALQPASAPVTVRQVSNRRSTASAPRRTVYREEQRSDDRIVARDEPAQPKRTWTKTAMIIGGTAASGAGVGAIVDGKKGAMIGAAIGGGAASIYEATRRR